MEEYAHSHTAFISVHCLLHVSSFAKIHNQAIRKCTKKNNLKKSIRMIHSQMAEISTLQKLELRKANLDKIEILY
jgi:hypothetical protein